MHAVIEVKGKQFLVQPGSRIRVSSMSEEAGTTIKISSVLLTTDDKKVETNSTMTVSAKVLTHGLDKKIEVYKHHAKKRYRRHQGHRQGFTELEIQSIDAAKPAAKAAKS